jgi:predicted phage tail protein
LKGLAPGAYVLRVQAASVLDEQTAFREVPFEIRGTTPAMTFSQEIAPQRGSY